MTSPSVLTQPYSLTGGGALVAGLVDHGVEVVFGIPGTHNLEIYRHLAQRNIRHVGVRHEQGTGYAADGYARVTGRPGVAVVTSGPALLNAATAVAQAWSDSIPILVISPGMPLDHPALGNGLLHESPDQGAAMRRFTAGSLRATSVAEIPRLVAQAFALMTSGRPRPVHLEVPLDLLTASAAVVFPPVVPSAHVQPDGAALGKAVDMLAAATAPVMIVGGGASGAAAQVHTLAEKLGAPVVTTINGKGILPEDHPLAMGAGVHLPTVRTLLTAADVVVAVGTELAPADLWYGPLPVDGKLIRIDIDPVSAITNAQPAVVVLGDAADCLDQLTALIPAPVAGVQHPQVWREQKNADARAEGADYLDWMEALAPVLPRETIVAADNAMASYYGAMTNLPTFTPRSFLFPAGFGTLGFALPAAIGAKIGAPDRPVIAIQGDGGFMFTATELAAAACEKLPLPVLVFDNAGYGEIRDEMIDRNDPVHAVTFPAPDFALFGKSLGCYGITVREPADLAEAVRTALTADRPTVIHIVMAEVADHTAGLEPAAAEGARS